MLASLAIEPSALFGPAQVQKFFFLLDQELADHIGGRFFDFRAYDYGPFDAEVYRELERLSQMGLVQILSGDVLHRRFLLTSEGYEWGKRFLRNIEPIARKKIRKISEWVRTVSFRELITEIYRYYPKMRENSVFEKS